MTDDVTTQTPSEVRLIVAAYRRRRHQHQEPEPIAAEGAANDLLSRLSLEDLPPAQRQSLEAACRLSELRQM